MAARESSVLIWGESGTGKELVARAIHRNSGRAAKPFVAINCAAIAETLLESELFGHEKGAFTGAVAQKRGKLELADGGTVFLDEIGELALSLQAKLLRVLQEREVERVGGTRTVKLDIRLVAATNRDLKAAVRSGTFREDLYYRLNVVSIRVPALRERREDISLLASYFTARSGEKVNRRVMGISPSARACLMRYDWPGNVRELENAIERAVVLGSSEVILPEDLPDAVAEEAAPGDETVTPLHHAVREAKKLVVWRAIEQAGENYTEAAKALGVHPNHLFRLVRTLGLETEEATVKSAINSTRSPSRERPNRAGRRRRKICHQPTARLDRRRPRRVPVPSIHATAPSSLLRLPRGRDDNFPSAGRMRKRYRPSPLHRSTDSPGSMAATGRSGPASTARKQSRPESTMTTDLPSGETLDARTPSGVIGLDWPPPGPVRMCAPAGWVDCPRTESSGCPGTIRRIHIRSPSPLSTRASPAPVGSTRSSERLALR